MRYLVVHAHLYQPPRENPWLELIERQPSAAPSHDWNERVSDECYERFGGASVRGPDRKVIALLNLFGRISFNVGPTLAAWLARARPEVLADALAGDRAAIERSGAGAAIMQPYGHPIMPLCEAREKRIQIAWGAADFRFRFQRAPEGIWFPETAIDVPSLEAAADMGLRYTIVAPEQVIRIRPLGALDWLDVSGQRVPPHRPYLVRLPSGRTITIFVFDGPLSRGVAFGGRLQSGESLLGAFRSGLDGIPDGEGIALLAADGETFGHHQRHAEESLAEALVRARLSGLAQVTHAGDLYHRLRPTHEAILAEPSSWSCPHGVGRWQTDCGCGSRAPAGGWQWAWRGPLRHAVTMLRDRVFALVDRQGETMFEDPWAALEAYGDVLVRPPSPEAVADFVTTHGARRLDDAGRERAASLLELVRQVLCSATSCGWFFDDIAGIEGVQVLRHAARACDLARTVFGIDPEPELIQRLSAAQANEPGTGSGADTYRQRAQVAVRDPREVAGLHAAHLIEVELDGKLSAFTAAAAYGCHSVDEVEAPLVKRAEGGSLEVSGVVRVIHLRGLGAREVAYRVATPGPGKRTELELDGEPVATPSPRLREELLALASRRATRLLPAADRGVLNEVAWICRQAREDGIPLPSPFMEAIGGSARALIRVLLESHPSSAARTIRELQAALATAVGAGITRAELGDLRPLLDRRLAFLLAWSLGSQPAQAATEELCLAIATAREALGDDVLNRSRRFIVGGAPGVPLADRIQLAEAAGLSADALAPVDTPVRPIEEETQDSLA